MKQMSWFDEMNLRYLWRKLSSTVAKLSGSYLKINQAATETAKSINELMICFSEAGGEQDGI